MNDDKRREQPFFARFLEGQFPEVESDVHSGDGWIDPGRARKPGLLTMKYPSDDDEYVTLKYPSDSDEA